MSDNKNPTGLPYRPSLAVDDWVIISGQLGLKDGQLVESFEAQTAQMFENLKTRLQEHGLTVDHLVKTTCFLTDLDNFAAFNTLYAEALGEARPARSAVQVARLPFDAEVEIEAWAHKG